MGSCIALGERERVVEPIHEERFEVRLALGLLRVLLQPPVGLLGLPGQVDIWVLHTELVNPLDKSVQRTKVGEAAIMAQYLEPCRKIARRS